MRVKIAFQENIIFLRKNYFCIGFCIKKEGRAHVDFLVAPLFRGKKRWEYRGNAVLFLQVEIMDECVFWGKNRPISPYKSM